MVCRTPLWHPYVLGVATNKWGVKLGPGPAQVSSETSIRCRAAHSFWYTKLRSFSYICKISLICNMKWWYSCYLEKNLITYYHLLNDESWSLWAMSSSPSPNLANWGFFSSFMKMSHWSFTLLTIWPKRTKNSNQLLVLKSINKRGHKWFWELKIHVFVPSLTNFLP